MSHDTLAKLREELGAIDARNCVLEFDAAESEFTRDGTLKVNAKLRTQGIVVRFTDSRGGSVAMPCDTFDQWADNARAIALTLEKLRAIDRYGVTKSGEQYSGFRALPAFTGTAAAGVETIDAAAAFLARLGDTTASGILTDITVARKSWRIARAKTHPDSGGDDTEFQRTTVAEKLLAAHFGVPAL